MIEDGGTNYVLTSGTPIKNGEKVEPTYVRQRMRSQDQLIRPDEERPASIRCRPLSCVRTDASVELVVDTTLSAQIDGHDHVGEVVADLHDPGLLSHLDGDLGCIDDPKGFGQVDVIEADLDRISIATLHFHRDLRLAHLRARLESTSLIP